VSFLTEINTQNTSIIATQLTKGMTISGLGYTDAENELVATTVDTAGNVNTDEVAPTSVTQVTLYTAVAEIFPDAF